MNARYKNNVGVVSSLRYHIVWCPKYCKAILNDSVAQRLACLLNLKAAEIAVTIHALEIMPDCVQLQIEADPTMCVAEIVNRFKGFTSKVLREEFGVLRSRLPCMWNRTYYARTVDAGADSTVSCFIAGQKGK